MIFMRSCFNVFVFLTLTLSPAMGLEEVVDTNQVNCKADVRTCPNGAYVSRDHNNNCEFFSCTDSNPIEENSEELIKQNHSSKSLERHQKFSKDYISYYNMLILTAEIIPKRCKNGKEKLPPLLEKLKRRSKNQINKEVQRYTELENQRDILKSKMTKFKNNNADITQKRLFKIQKKQNIIELDYLVGKTNEINNEDKDSQFKSGQIESIQNFLQEYQALFQQYVERGEEKFDMKLELAKTKISEAKGHRKDLCSITREDSQGVNSTKVEDEKSEVSKDNKGTLFPSKKQCKKSRKALKTISGKLKEYQEIATQNIKSKTLMKRLRKKENEILELNDEIPDFFGKVKRKIRNAYKVLNNIRRRKFLVCEQIPLKNGKTAKKLKKSKDEKIFKAIKKLYLANNFFKKASKKQKKSEEDNAQNSEDSKKKSEKNTKSDEEVKKNAFAKSLSFKMIEVFNKLDKFMGSPIERQAVLNTSTKEIQEYVDQATLIAEKRNNNISNINKIIDMYDKIPKNNNTNMEQNNNQESGNQQNVDKVVKGIDVVKEIEDGNVDNRRNSDNFNLDGSPQLSQGGGSILSNQAEDSNLAATNSSSLSLNSSGTGLGVTSSGANSGNNAIRTPRGSDRVSKTRGSDRVSNTRGVKISSLKAQNERLKSKIAKRNNILATARKKLSPNSSNSKKFQQNEFFDSLDDFASYVTNQQNPDDQRKTYASSIAYNGLPKGYLRRSRDMDARARDLKNKLKKYYYGKNSSYSDSISNEDDEDEEDEGYYSEASDSYGSNEDYDDEEDNDDEYIIISDPDTKRYQKVCKNMNLNGFCEDQENSIFDNLTSRYQILFKNKRIGKENDTGIGKENDTGIGKVK